MDAKDTLFKYKYVIINVNKDGTVSITEQELAEMLEKAYQDGYTSGFCAGSSSIPNGWWPPQVTYGTGTPVQDTAPKVWMESKGYIDSQENI